MEIFENWDQLTLVDRLVHLFNDHPFIFQVPGDKNIVIVMPSELDLYEMHYSFPGQSFEVIYYECPPDWFENGGRRQELGYGS